MFKKRKKISFTKMNEGRVLGNDLKPVKPAYLFL